MHLSHGLLLLLFVVFVFIGLVSVALPILLGDSTNSRLKHLQTQREKFRSELTKGETKTSGTGIRNRVYANKNKKWQRVLSEKFDLTRFFNLEKLRRKLMIAGYRDSNALHTFVIAVFTVPIILGGLGLEMAYGLDVGDKSTKPFIVVGFFFFGMALPNILTQNAIIKRKEALNKQLPEALDLIVVCVEAGLSLEQAFMRVNLEIGTTMPEVSEEFSIAGAELAYMGDRVQAFNNLEVRTDIPEYKELSLALLQSETYGTPVISALKTISRTARRNKFMEIEKKAGALGPKMTIPMIILILPTMFLCLLGPAIIQLMKLR